MIFEPFFGNTKPVERPESSEANPKLADSNLRHPELCPLASASRGTPMIPVFPGKPQPFKDQQRSMTKGISSTTIERGGRRENRNLGKAEGRATKSWPQRGAASGAMQVIERPKVGPQGESRLWDKSRKTAARQLRRRSGLGKPANQMSGIERVKSDEFSRIGSGFAKEFHCRYYSCSFGKFVVKIF